MSTPDPTERVVITTPSDPAAAPQTGRWGGLVDALTFGSGSDVGDQITQTRYETPGLSLFRSGVKTVQPAANVDEYYEIYESTAIVFASLWNFASDVWEPGYRIETEDDDVAEWLEDQWLPQAAILHGGKQNDFLPFGKATTIQRWARGGALIEHVRNDPDEAESLVTGLNFIPPETVSFVPYKHKPILVDPEPPEALRDELPSSIDESITRRGEYPAYIQYHKNARKSTKRDPIPLSQNDVTRTVFNGDVAAVGTDLNHFWGTPVTEIIAEDVAGFKNVLRDKEVAIKNKAYGLWQLAFGRDVFEFHETDAATGERFTVEKVIEFDEDQRGEIADEIEDEMGPGSILTHDGVIELDRLEGEVPDLIADLEFYVSNIISALPTPLYMIGWESNVNQFVTEAQDSRYQRLIQWEREELERTFTSIMQGVIDTHPEYDADDVTFKIEPLEDESPIMSMGDDDMDRLERWADAFDKIRGDLPVDMFVDPEMLRTEILRLPEDAAPDLSELDLDFGDDTATVFDLEADDDEDAEDDGPLTPAEFSTPYDDD